MLLLVLQVINELDEVLKDESMSGYVTFTNCFK